MKEFSIGLALAFAVGYLVAKAFAKFVSSVYPPLGSYIS